MIMPRDSVAQRPGGGVGSDPPAAAGASLMGRLLGLLLQGMPFIFGIGFIAQGFDVSSYYRRTPVSHDPRAAFLFASIEEDVIGDFGAWGDGAAGLEIDCYDASLGSPPHALVVASSESHSNAFLLVNEEMLSNSRGVDGTLNSRIKADIVFFETPSGGAVLSTGSIAFIASLAHDTYRNNVSQLLRNALDRFMDPAVFTLPADGSKRHNGRELDI